MDKSSIAIGTILFVIFMFPIFYVLLNQKSRERKFKSELNKLASENGLKIDQFESFGHLSLGLDSNNKKLLVIEADSKIARRLIDLNHVKQVHLEKKTLKAGASKERIVHLGLEIFNKNSSEATEILFYDEDDYESTDADIRLHTARRWDELIQKNLAS